MGGVLLLLGYLFSGVALMDGLLPRKDRLVRLWLGLCAGLALMMWLPTLFAFFIRFTLAAQLMMASASTWSSKTRLSGSVMSPSRQKILLPNSSSIGLPK